MKVHLLPRPAVVNQPQSEADAPQPDFLVERIKDLTRDTYLGLTVHECDNKGPKAQEQWICIQQTLF